MLLGGLVTNILTAKSLSCRGTLHYPDFSVQQECPCFVTGPSGCGKSTLLHLLNCTIPADTGEVFLEEQSVFTMDKILVRRQILLAGQAPFLFSGTIEENFLMFYDAIQTPLPTQDSIKMVLKVCCADALSPTQSCTSFSGGERQRIFLAVALSFSAKVLLLDEPTSALDATLASQVLGNILEFQKAHQRACIVVCHDHTLTARYGEQQLMLGGKTLE